MLKLVTAQAFVAALILILVPSSARTQSLDSEAIARVSRAIAEWKLMDEDREEETPVYVSSSLGRTVQKGNNEAVGIVTGLTAFDDDMIGSQMRQWELNRSVDLSQKYISRLPTEIDNQISISSEIATGSLGDVYKRFGITTSGLENLFRAGQGLGPSTGALRNTVMGSTVLNTAGTLQSTAIAGAQNIDRLGTTAQVMSPPVYLHEKTAWGSVGSGSYSIPSGRVEYQEILITGDKFGGPNITRIHADRINTDTGYYFRQMRTTVPAKSPIERFMMHHYPVGNYYDLGNSTIRSTTRSYQRINIDGGIRR